MASRHPVLRHRFAGGWAPDFGTTAEVALEPLIQVPWLTRAENVQFVLDGGVRKIGGTERLNGTALEGGAAVLGLFDYWRHGTAGSPTQKRVIHIGTKIKKDDADGNFTDIFTGLPADGIPSYATFDDHAVLMSTAHTPKFWDQSTAKDLGTNTPNGSFGVTHQNRFWLAGDVTEPSRLYFSQALPDGADGDWDGTGAGLIDVDPGDGDKITGLVSYKNELWVFKGPFKGSIHRITGASPATFARTLFVRGLGCVAHNAIFPFQDDIGFVWADGSIHSLRATAAFGDFRESALSLPLNEWLRDHVRHDRLQFAWAANLVSSGIVLFTFSVDTATTNNLVLAMDYRFIPVEGRVRWSTWPAIEAASLANVIDQTGNDRPAIFVGGNDGFVRKLNRVPRSLDGTTGYTAMVTLPFLHYEGPVFTKVLGHLGVGIVPRGSAELTVRWRRDGHLEQSANLSQVSAGTDVLAPWPTDQFTLGTSQLGGAAFIDRFVNEEEGGEFRSIQYELEQGGNLEDMEVHTLSAETLPSAMSWEN